MLHVESPHHRRRRDVLPVPLDEGRAPDRTRVLDPSREPDREDQHRHRDAVVVGLPERGAGDPVHHYRDENGREGELDVGDAHGNRIHPAPDEARDEARRDPEEHREQHPGEPDEEGDAGSEDDGRDHVAALIVGPEQETRIAALEPDRGEERIGEPELVRIEGVVGGDDLRGEGGDREHEEDQGGRDRGRIAYEVVQEVAPGRGGPATRGAAPPAPPPVFPQRACFNDLRSEGVETPR